MKLADYVVSQPYVVSMNLRQYLKPFERAPYITTSHPNYREIIKDEIWVVDDFLSEKECETLIEVTENSGYEDALVTTGVGKGAMRKDIRDSKRNMLDDHNLAEYYFDKCKLFSPAAYEGRLLASVNERMRFLKYDHPGAKFVRHCDGSYPGKDNQRSKITMQLYLNQDYEGGETTFYSPKFENSTYKYKARTGSCLFFRQYGWMHEGSELIKGIKYTLRTELMYKSFQNKEDISSSSLQCPKCRSNVSISNLHCGHPFLQCACTPFNTRYRGSCGVCDAFIK
jgi:hypothetical protein